jgi:hypothetical protein
MAAQVDSAVFSLQDLLERMNALPKGPRRGNDRWTARSLRKMLEAGGVQFVQREKGCKRYVTLTALRDAFPEFIDSLLFAEALNGERDAA